MKKWNWKLIGISLAIVVAIVPISLWLFPQWGINARAIVAIVGAAIPVVIDTLSKAKELFGKDDKKTNSVSNVGSGTAQGLSTGNIGDGANVTNQQTNINQQTIYNTPADLTPLSLHQIPAPPPDFTGREEELAALCQAVQKEGVVLSGVRGMGGVGKTALALVLVQRLAPDYPDAQLIVNMYGAPDTPTPPTAPAAAMQQVIRAFHPTAQLPEDQNQLAALYQSVLHDKRALILLDDARDAAQVKPLLPPATCLLLVTTRQRFTLPGLKELDLDTLSEAESIELIRKITPRAGTHVSQIAKACGHLPLALRLAASALREQTNLSSAALLTRLNDAEKRFNTLKEVQAAIQVSYDLLTEDLQTTLRQLAVFPADFDQPASAAVWNVDEDADTAQDHLASLINASLVDYDVKTQRYRLHDLVRAAADKLLAGEEREQAAYRHAAHYLQVLEIADDIYLEGDDQIIISLGLFDQEKINIKAGQAWAAVHTKCKRNAQMCTDYANAGIYCRNLRLHPYERINWLNNGLRATPEFGNPISKSVILGNLGLAYADLGQYQKAILYHQQSLEIARKIGYVGGEGASIGNLGIAYYCLSLYPKAIDCFQKQLEISRQIGDQNGEETVLGNLGLVYIDLGQYQKAIECYQQQFEIAHEIGNLRNEGTALGNLGLIYAEIGYFPQAIEYYHQHLKITRKIGDQQSEGNTLGNLGSSYFNTSQYHKALGYYKQSLVIFQEIGDRRGEGTAFGNLGLVYAGLGQYQKAIAHYEKHLQIAREISDRRGEANTSWNLGHLLAHQGQLQEAILLMQVNVDFLTEIDHPDAEKDARYLKQLLSQSGKQ